jgi:hypothetical protein
MCTGRPPFGADNSHTILRMITDDEPRSIRKINPDIPEWLCTLIMCVRDINGRLVAWFILGLFPGISDAEVDGGSISAW